MQMEYSKQGKNMDFAQMFGWSDLGDDQQRTCYWQGQFCEASAECDSRQRFRSIARPCYLCRTAGYLCRTGRPRPCTCACWAYDASSLPGSPAPACSRRPWRSSQVMMLFSRRSEQDSWCARAQLFICRRVADRTRAPSARSIQRACPSTVAVHLNSTIYGLHKNMQKNVRSAESSRGFNTFLIQLLTH